MNITTNPSSGFWQLTHVSDDQLVAGLGSLMQACRRVTARVIAHLAEVEERRLHLRAACSSMFVYCTDRLGMSEDEACRRIDAARIARRYPLAYRLLDSGELTLTVLCLLKDLLTAENHAELMAGVSGKSVREAREWLAARFPRPDAPSLIRKLPEQRELGAVATAVPPAASPAIATPQAASAPPSTPARSPLPAPSRARVEPLSEARYKVQFTATRELKDKLELARDLMSHHRGADLSVIVERALDLLVATLMKKRFGSTDRPQRPRGAQPERVTNATRRAVVERDGLACSFVDGEGRRCGERALLEHEHAVPRGRGGDSRLENARIFCAGHNRLEAERVYGREHIERAVAKRRAKAGAGSSGSSAREAAPARRRG